MTALDAWGSTDIGVRVHDIGHGLVGVSGGLVNVGFRNTRLHGAVAQVVSLVSGLQEARYSQLLAAAGELGIDDSLLDRALSKMQDLDFCRVLSKPSSDHKVEVRVPLVRDRYADIGESWRVCGPTETEAAALQILDDVALVPRYQDDLFDTHGLLGSETGAAAKDVLTSAGVLGTYVSPSTSREVLYSPLYWEERPDALDKLTSKYDLGQVSSALEGVRDYQGRPVTGVSDAVLLSVVDTGLLPTTSISSSSGERRYLFTPFPVKSNVEKEMVKKAFAWITAVRYGQHDARHSRIRYTASQLLQHIRGRKQIGPHSEILTEYFPLVKLMVGRTEEGPSGRYTFYLNDTDDNMAALDLAIRIASFGQVSAATSSIESAARTLLLPGSYRDPTRTRIEVRRTVGQSPKSLQSIAAIISGVSPDVV